MEDRKVLFTPHEKVYVIRRGFYGDKKLQGTVEGIGADGWSVLVKTSQGLVAGHLSDIYRMPVEKGDK